MANPPKGPDISAQYEDQAQCDAVKRAAQEDGVKQAEMIRRLIAYGLVMREKARAGAYDAGDAGSPWGGSQEPSTEGIRSGQ